MGVMRNVVITLGGIIGSEIAYFLYKKLTNNTSTGKSDGKNEHELVRWFKTNFDEIGDDEYFYKVLFFPDPGMTCARNMAGRVCLNPNCVALHKYTNLATLVKMIDMAKHTVEVCVYLFTSHILGDALVKRQEEGVEVFVITDDRNSGEMADLSAAGAQMGKLRAAGIAVVCHESSFWMHHKFMIIDQEIVAMGSFNWTNSGAMGNFESYVISNNPKLVQPFVNEFDRLWIMHQPTLV